MDGAQVAPAKGTRFSRRWLPRVALALVIALALVVWRLAVPHPAARNDLHPVARNDNSAAILADWRSFPVDADPRAPVLTGPTILDFPIGFTGSAPDVHQQALASGEVELAAVLPATPTTAGGYPVIPAKVAVARFREAYPQDARHAGRSAPGLRIDEVSLGQASFETDRGLRRLPAWRLSFDRVDASSWVFAVARKALWTPKPTSAYHPRFAATLSSDGRSLTVNFLGASDEPTACGVAYTASAAESATAVVIVLHSTPRRRVGPEVTELMCPGASFSRTVTTRLATPLGRRVLLTPYGVPLPMPSS